MTVHGSESVAVNAFRLGVRGYITKPFNLDEMLAAIERALEEGQLRRERKRWQRSWRWLWTTSLVKLILLAKPRQTFARVSYIHP